MGDAKRNCYPLPHFQDNVPLFGEWRFRAHFGQGSVDTESPLFSHSGYKALSAATGSQSAFDSAVANLSGDFPAWYANLDSTFKGLIRLSVIEMHATN